MILKRVFVEWNRVLILYTGGTIGMKKDASGLLAPATNYLEEQIRQMTMSLNNIPDIEV